MNFDWEKYPAAIWRAKKELLKPVRELDSICLDDLINIDIQKNKIIDNTENFLLKKPCNNALLWGARGTGKSSLIKALLNKYKEKGLRVIEIDREDLDDLIEIVDLIREEEYSFIIFCDDLSFEEGEKGYKGLKRVLEGSIEIPPKNVLIYATSNRRHLISEYHKDNEGSSFGNRGEIHYSDSVEEKISLSDRFGLWIPFYNGNYEDYKKYIDHYFKNFKGNKEKLYEEAFDFSNTRASKSARTAKQFFNTYNTKIKE